MTHKVYRVNDTKHGIRLSGFVFNNNKKLQLIVYSGTVSAVFQNCISKHGRGGQTLNTIAGVPPYLLIQYPRFQLSAVHRGLKKKLVNETNIQFVTFKMPPKQEWALTW
jgi:hypothetical protein